MLRMGVMKQLTPATVGFGQYCGAAMWMGSRIASPGMLREADLLPHLICWRPIFIGGANDEADQHDST
jgi:hypothetical protein